MKYRISSQQPQKIIKGLCQSTFQAKIYLCRCSGRDDHDLIVVKSYEVENSSIFEGTLLK